MLEIMVGPFFGILYTSVTNSKWVHYTYRYTWYPTVPGTYGYMRFEGNRSWNFEWDYCFRQARVSFSPERRVEKYAWNERGTVFFFWYTSITGEPTIIVMRSQCGVSTQGNTWFLGTSWVLIACNICPPVIVRYGGNVLGIKVVWGVSPAAGRSLRYIVVWRETEVGLCGAITLWRVSLGSTI